MNNEVKSWETLDRYTEAYVEGLELLKKAKVHSIPKKVLFSFSLRMMNIREGNSVAFATQEFRHLNDDISYEMKKCTDQRNKVFGTQK